MAPPGIELNKCAAGPSASALHMRPPKRKTPAGLEAMQLEAMQLEATVRVNLQCVRGRGRVRVRVRVRVKG